jgi:hypothetical protein
MITVSILFFTIVISVIINEGGSAIISEQNSAQLLLLYDLFETALTDNTSNLLNLRRVYYHPAGKIARDIRLSATVAFVVNEPLADDKNYTNVYGQCPMLGTCNDRGASQRNQYCENYFSFVLGLNSNNDDGSLQISDLVGFDGYDAFKIFDPTFSYVMGTLAIPQFLNVLFSDSLNDDDEIKLYFNINELESTPDYGDICDTLSMLLVWVSEHLILS